MTRVFANGKWEEALNLPPLQWMDGTPDEEFQERRLMRGRDSYFDIGHSDPVAAWLQVPAESARYGRLRFPNKGIYTVEVLVDIDVPFRSRYVQAEIRFDPARPLETDLDGKIRVSWRRPKGLLLNSWR